MREDGKIDYVEFPGADLSEVKRFYGAAFGWTFQDYGPAYVAFEGAGVDGGFDADRAEGVAKPMVVLFAHDLEAMLERIRGAGGVITRPILGFPGGRRFHFRDPSGNELGVWSET
jgi:predicted enzyme related to lactoylglutathione lyase